MFCRPALQSPAARNFAPQPVREVTLSVWKVMLHLRRALLTPMPLPPSVSMSGPLSSTTSPPPLHQHAADPGTTSGDRVPTASGDETRNSMPIALTTNRADTDATFGGGDHGYGRDGSARGGHQLSRSETSGQNRNPDWEDVDALDYWVRTWAAGGPGAPSGDTLQRYVWLTIFTALATLTMFVSSVCLLCSCCM